MKKTLLGIVLCVTLGLLLQTFPFAEEAPLKYPVAKKVDHTDDYFGTKVADPYRWMEDTKSDDTVAWINAELALTDQYLSAIPFRTKIKDRLTELWNYERYSAPQKIGDHYIFRKNNGLQEQSVIYIQKGLDGKPEVLLDPNTFSKDGSISLGGINFSKDYRYMSYMTSTGGSDWRDLYVMEVQSRKLLTDHLQWIKFSFPSWYKDGFFYSRYDEPPKDADNLKISLQNQKLYYHKLGTPQSEDKLIYQNPDNPKQGFFGFVPEEEKYLIISVWQGGTDYNLLYYKNLETDSPVTPIIADFIGHFNISDVIGDKFLLTTDYEAPNYKCVLVDPLKPQKENWETVIPESTDKLEGASLVGGKLIAEYLKDANTKVSIFDEKGKYLYDVQLPGIGTAGGFGGKKEDNEVFYTFTSFTTPPMIYHYDIKANKSTLFRQAAVKFNPEDFETRQVFYESKDKTRVPMFITYKKGLKLDGHNPTMLYGYGGFNVAMIPVFQVSLIPLLEKGGVYASACIRGGSEYGEKWHAAGTLDKKQNVFDDFIAAAEYLIREKYTSPERLAINGGSNGGLLVAAVTNQRPDLFKVAIPQVGVMDMLRFQKFTIGWAWVSDYGSSDNPEQFKFLYAYSPIHNIKEGVEYPAIMATTADHDDRVFPAHSFKYIAALQEKYKGKNPILIRIETKVGHGAGTSTSKYIDLFADMYAFMFYNMNLKF